ncbi:hypothetical protein Droror1_Dr00027711 [Drosera rotundifolia]
MCKVLVSAIHLAPELSEPLGCARNVNVIDFAYMGVSDGLLLKIIKAKLSLRKFNLFHCHNFTFSGILSRLRDESLRAMVGSKMERRSDFDSDLCLQTNESKMEQGNLDPHVSERELEDEVRVFGVLHRKILLWLLGEAVAFVAIMLGTLLVVHGTKKRTIIAGTFCFILKWLLLDRLSLDRTVKALGVCNGITHGVEAIRHAQKLAEVVVLALEHR